MKESFKKNWLSFLIVLVTTILAAVAVITAVRIYELRNQSIAPTAPGSKPKAVSPQCTLVFSIVTPTLTPTPTGILTPTPTPTPISTVSPTSTPTPTPTGILTPTPTPTPISTVSPTSTPTPTSPPQSQAIPTPTDYVAQAKLPQAGITMPTVGAFFGGVILLLTSLLLIF